MSREPIPFRTQIDIEECLKEAFGLLSRGDPWKPEVVTDDFIIRCLLLIHSEVSEATEALRKGLMDDKLPFRRGIEVELADVVIRCIKLAHHAGFDLAGAIAEKEAFNRVRSDHRPEERAKAGGKRF